eukprot:TRINITY_DN3037_c0_g1_i1.p4 TRINITY_DN3037_c0_g1~~TRINITY_DN3037_c0_g1_i1.p4  ORF type:complete len:175 (-),score=34.76 TRINITY_DN3037_c0_g1_i1:909-1433(-)
MQANTGQKLGPSVPLQAVSMSAADDVVFLAPRHPAGWRDISLPSLALASSSSLLQIVADEIPVEIAGHDIAADPNVDSMPFASRRGVVTRIGHMRGFVRTEAPTVLGMCGGPVIRGNDAVGLLVALVTGTGKADSAVPDLVGQSLMVPASRLSQLFHEAVAGVAGGPAEGDRGR